MVTSGRGTGDLGMGVWEVQTTEYKTGSKLYCTTWGESQHFVITVSGKQPLKIV